MHSPCYTLQQTSKDFERNVCNVKAFDAFYHMNLLIKSNRDKSAFGHWKKT